MHRHMMHRECAVASDDHDAINNRLIIEGDRMRGNDWLRARNLLAECGRNFVLECTDTIKRQCTANRHAEIDEGLLADGTCAHLLNPDYARHMRGNGGDFFRGAAWRDIGECVDGALA